MPIPFAAAAAGFGALGGITKMISGAKRRKRAEQMLQNLQNSRQEFKNIHEGRRISTRGSEFARQGIQGTQATSAAALQSGGVRGVVGGMQGVQNSASQYLQQEGSQLDQQQVALDRDMAQDEARIQAMNERRQMNDEATAQDAINAGYQDQMSGLGDIAGAAFGAGSLQAMGGQGGGGGLPNFGNMFAKKPNPMQGYNPAQGAARANARNAFGVTNPIFTGERYGVGN